MLDTPDTAVRGFQPDLLAQVPAGLQPFVNNGDLSGAVTLIWRGGKIAQVNTLGFRDLEAKAPMQRDTLFWIASMTKPVTTVAALMLMEAGALKLSDPITRWAPEFADMRVVRDPNGSIEDTVPAHREITIEDLMTHRSGLAYGFSSKGPLADAHDKALGHPLFSPLDPDGWLASLAAIPLSYQPGERLHYSHATEVLGFLVGRIAGTSLRQFLMERIFGPLGMRDTDFWVAPEKRDRLATLYGFDEGKGGLVPVPMPLPDSPPAYTAGGGGLISTADDYLKFARMLLNDGEVDGVRLLRPETVRDMRTNRLTPEQREVPFLGLPMWAGMGFGLGLSVVDAPERNMLGVGSVGSFGWPGAYGTWWQADPVKDLITIFLIQHAIPLGPDAGSAIAAGRGMAGRMALPAFQRLTYAALA
jgi:CubicO group peptidase (beta-lactamase class C family)